MSTEQPGANNEEKQLQRGMFGYRRAEVDAAFGSIEAERAALRSDLAATRLELERTRAQLQEREAQATDVRAELVQARQQLEQDRQGILHEKEMVLEAAHELADEIQRRAQRRITEEGWELHKARIERQRFVESFRGLLLKYMEEVDRLSTGLGVQAPTPGIAVAEIPPEVFSAAAERLFVPPGFEAPDPTAAPSKERFSS